MSSPFDTIDHEDSIPEKVWNHLRARDAPVPQNPDTPDRYYPPTVECTYLVHEDGSTEIIGLSIA